MELAFKIHESLTPKAKRAILNQYFRTKSGLNSHNLRDLEYDAFFLHYENLCQQQPINELGQLYHSEVFLALDAILQDAKEVCIESLKTSLWHRSPQLETKDVDLFVLRWIEFTSKACLLVDSAEWRTDETLEQSIFRRIFPRSTISDKARLTRKFNAMNLERIGGFKVRWTGILSEHLMFEEDSMTISIFHQAQMLELLSATGIFPLDLVKETRMTFDILFPCFDSKSRSWFRDKQSRLKPWAAEEHAHLDTTILSSKNLAPAQRRTENFHYFRERLIILREEYDAHEPQNISQYWYDYRRPAQWWAFWIAVLVFVFGLCQVTEGAIQCYKAYHPS